LSLRALSTHKKNQSNLKKRKIYFVLSKLQLSLHKVIKTQTRPHAHILRFSATRQCLNAKHKQKAELAVCALQGPETFVVNSD
jgi:glutamate synthase domain-containing protein 1